MRTEAICRLIPHAERFVTEREAERRREGTADFDDLLVWARKLLIESEEARTYFRKRFPVLLVDEFQDTDPVQAEIAVLIASEGPVPDDVLDLTPRPGRPHRRRRPEAVDLPLPWRRYLGLRRRPQRAASGRPSAARPELPLHRGRDQLAQRGLRPGTRRDGRRAAPEHPARPDRDAGLADESRSICVLRAEPAENAAEARANEARLVAGSIRLAIDEGWPVRDEKTQAERPATFGDVAILFPTRTGLEEFEAALRRQEIPYRVEGGRGFFAAPGDPRPLEPARLDRRPGRLAEPRRNAPLERVRVHRRGDLPPRRPPSPARLPL